jgi:hypothetical protein
MISWRRILLLAAVAAPLVAVSSCGQDLFPDAGFDLWCGDELCAWDVEQGEVVRVSTWHELDYGAELVGPAVVISQLSEASVVECITVTLIADADDGADLSLEMDFLDDGIVEYSAPIPADTWEQVSFHVTPPPWYQGVRFRVRKTGDARAVIAQVRAQSDSGDACTASPLALTNLPNGAECDASVAPSDACGGGACSEVPVLSSGDDFEVDTCGGCDVDTDCGTGEVCGLAWGELDYGFRDCRPEAQKDLGVACIEDAECGSGVCCDSQCAECCADAPCEGGVACSRHPAWQDPYGGVPAPEGISPYMCDAGPRVAGAACLTHDDCASGGCYGSTITRICDPDGRPCGSDQDCPWAALGALCVDVGVEKGVCL